MRDNLSTYKIWAPDNSLWTAWVKPVLFTSSPYGYNSYNLDIPNINWISEVNYNTMIIIDIPNDKGVKAGLALARIGYRPIPLYNGVKGPVASSMIIDVSNIEKALFNGATQLENLNIRSDAPPAFLLDSRRMKGIGKKPGKFDNRWCIFPQDMPSASYLKEKGISKIILRTTEIQDDLTHILCRYQEQGIKIYICYDNENIKDIKIHKPSRYKSLVYRFKVTLGLVRNASGGFGGQIPEPTQYNSGSRYYGIG